MQCPEVITERQARAWTRRGIGPGFIEYLQRNGQVAEGRGGRVYVKIGMASLCKCGRRKHTDAQMCKQCRIEKGIMGG